jgi:hypothetical protein
LHGGIILPPLSGWLTLQEIDVCLGNQGRFRYLQPGDQIARLLVTAFRRFVRGEYDFQLDETSEVLDDVEMNSSSTHEEQLAPFDDDATTREHAGERF